MEDPFPGNALLSNSRELQLALLKRPKFHRSSLERYLALEQQQRIIDCYEVTGISISRWDLGGDESASRDYFNYKMR
jgi:hypothetical protein